MNYQTFTTQQKWSVIQKVESSSDKSRELLKLGIPRSTYYDWLKVGGQSQKKTPHTIWNKTPSEIETCIRTYRLSGDPLKHSPARIVEQLEQYDNFIISESGAKSVLVRLGLNGFLKPKKKHYRIRPKAGKFLEVVCVDDVEFIRQRPHDTYVLNFTDEASYSALESRVYEHRTNSYDIIKGLKNLRQTYGRYPKVLRLDNAQAHKARKVIRFCKKNNIKMDFITKGCPEENWPVESWHRNLNQDVVYQHGYSTIAEWQKAVDDYRYFHNHIKRLRSDPIKRTPYEIALAYTSPLTQARLKTVLKRKLYGQTSVQKHLPDLPKHQPLKLPAFKPLSVSEMCVS